MYNLDGVRDMLLLKTDEVVKSYVDELINDKLNEVKIDDDEKSINIICHILPSDENWFKNLTTENYFTYSRVTTYHYDMIIDNINKLAIIYIFSKYIVIVDLKTERCYSIINMDVTFSIVRMFNVANHRTLYELENIALYIKLASEIKDNNNYNGFVYITDEKAIEKILKIVDSNNYMANQV